MKLNLTIVKDGLNDYPVIQENLDRLTPRRLTAIQFYKKDAVFHEDILYFCSAEDLPAQPQSDTNISLICLGFLPTAFALSEQCEYLCFSSSTSEKDLFQTILDIFIKYEQYDMHLKDMMIQNCTPEELGELALEIFQTPVHAYGVFEKILFMVWDKSRAEDQELYENYKDGYVSEDERSILYMDKEFMSEFELKGPTYSANDIYKTQIIFFNIFSDNVYIGRFLIENTYRTFRDSDYPLTEWFAGYVRILLERTRQFNFHTTREFEQMVQELLLTDASYLKEYKYALKSVEWEKEDDYLCIAYTAPETPAIERTLNDAAFYLEDLFDSQYIYLANHYILQIINITRSTIPQSEIKHRIGIFLKNNALLAGTSNLFSDFEQFPLHFQQARLMSRFALEDRKEKLYDFDSNVLSLMLNQISKTGKPEIYCSQKIQALFNYDRDNGSELAKTLKCYMENNQNVSQATRQLYIARTTCLYRLERIKELTHINFDDPKETLYVRLILQLLDI